MDEKNFFNEGGVSVSNIRFIAQGQTHAMSGITSVKAFRKNPPRKLLIFIGIMGLVQIGLSMPVLGLILLAMAAAMWFFTKPLYSVILNSASGENSAFNSKDGDFISRVVGALNDAIVHRG